MRQELKDLIRQRAEFRCEYCRMPERFLSYYRFEPDHIRPRKFDGITAEENLARACPASNRHKGPLMAALDPDSGEIVRLFNPRLDAWGEQFVYRSQRIWSLTAIGRATIWTLRMNSAEYIQLRETLGNLFAP